jgi:uncharacterized delta-60 repeat protein
VATDLPYAPGVTNSRIGMALQSDGKILLVGGLTLLRFKADGTLDASFGSGGQVHVPFSGGVFDTAQDVAVQADGKIVVVGFTTTLSGQDDFALVRFDASGALDPGFGIGGKAITDFGASNDRARRIRIQADGKLLVAGFATFISSPTVASESFALARYNADGSLDTAYATGGKAHDSPGGSYDYAQGLAIQGDGKVVVVGQSANLGSNPDMAIVRYAATGTAYDTSFGTDGKLTIDFFGGIDGAEAVAQQPDGKLIVGGFARFNGKTVLALARLLP